MERNQNIQPETKLFNETMLMEMLQILNSDKDISDVISSILELIIEKTGVDAAGIRLKNSDDFPYLYHKGFSNEFIKTENSIIKKTADGGVCRDKDGNICLECTCGLVICGKTDPSNELYTKNGSAWTNYSLPFLEHTDGTDPRNNPRNKCIHEGYMSVALIPIRNNNQIIGLLQLNAKEKNQFTLEMIEFFEGLTASIGIALMHYQKTEKLKAKTGELNHFFDLTVEREVAMVELKKEVNILLKTSGQREKYRIRP